MTPVRDIDARGVSDVAERGEPAGRAAAVVVRDGRDRGTHVVLPSASRRLASSVRPRPSQEQRHRDEQRAEEEQPVLAKAAVNTLFAPLTIAAPTIGPNSVPRPPIATQITISIESTAPSRSD